MWQEGALLPMSATASKTLRRLDEAEQALTQQRGHAPSLAELAALVRSLMLQQPCTLTAESSNSLQ